VSIKILLNQTKQHARVFENLMSSKIQYFNCHLNNNKANQASAFDL